MVINFICHGLAALSLLCMVACTSEPKLPTTQLASENRIKALAQPDRTVRDLTRTRDVQLRVVNAATKQAIPELTVLGERWGKLIPEYVGYDPIPLRCSFLLCYSEMGSGRYSTSIVDNAAVAVSMSLSAPGIYRISSAEAFLPSTGLQQVAHSFSASARLLSPGYCRHDFESALTLSNEWLQGDGEALAVPTKATPTKPRQTSAPSTTPEVAALRTIELLPLIDEPTIRVRYHLAGLGAHHRFYGSRDFLPGLDKFLSQIKPASSDALANDVFVRELTDLREKTYIYRSGEPPKPLHDLLDQWIARASADAQPIRSPNRPWSLIATSAEPSNVDAAITSFSVLCMKGEPKRCNYDEENDIGDTPIMQLLRTVAESSIFRLPFVISEVSSQPLLAPGAAAQTERQVPSVLRQANVPDLIDLLISLDADATKLNRVLDVNALEMVLRYFILNSAPKDSPREEQVERKHRLFIRMMSALIEAHERSPSATLREDYRMLLIEMRENLLTLTPALMERLLVLKTRAPLSICGAKGEHENAHYLQGPGRNRTALPYFVNESMQRMKKTYPLPFGTNINEIKPAPRPIMLGEPASEPQDMVTKEKP